MFTRSPLTFVLLSVLVVGGVLFGIGSLSTPLLEHALGEVMVLAAPLGPGTPAVAAPPEGIARVHQPADSVSGAARTARRLPRAAVAAPPPEEIREPLFAFVLQMIRADSLGVWRSADIEAFIAERGGAPSRLPLGRLVSLSRDVMPDSLVRERRGARSIRRWILTLDADCDFPMPYAILGYHPGTLAVSRTIEVSEWPLGDLNLRAGEDGGVVMHPLSDVTALGLERGYVVLDVDGWLDELLGKALDDTWTVGFALARAGDGWLGLGIGRGRGGRRIFGAFDFAEDKVRPHGEPREQALSRFCRGYVRHGMDGPNPPWSWDR